MTITELRTMFKDISGRADLADADCDLYINAGQRFLDDMVNHSKSTGQLWGSVAQGAFYFAFTQDAKLVEAVDLVDAEGNFVHLQYVKAYDLQSDLQLVGCKTQAVPYYFSDINLRRIPDSTDMAADSFTGKRDIIEVGSGLSSNAVLFDVPMDKDYKIRVLGKFYSSTLSGTITETWWSKQYPLTLIDAAMYKLETKYRNTQGMKDWLAAITDTIKQIEYNEIEKLSQHISRMEG